MKRKQFTALRLRDFRCFHDEQVARLAPLTLLVGDNSTGKTSFLAAIRAIWEVAYRSNEPDFRSPPYDLGAFSEIVHNPSKRSRRASSFEIGFSGKGRSTPVSFNAVFESRAAAPYPAEISLDGEGLWIKSQAEKDSKPSITLGSADRSWVVGTTGRYSHISPFRPPMIYSIQRELYELEDTHERSKKKDSVKDIPTLADISKLRELVQEFTFVPQNEDPFASAPIRSSPRRTYDPARPLPDPEGAYVPTYFASLNFRDHNLWSQLRGSLEDFGRDSGLFHEISVKQLGNSEGGPFQLEVRKFGKKRKGRKRNLINDKKLISDFKNRKIIDEPEGKVYSTNYTKSFSAEHEELFEIRNLCGI